MPVLPSAGALVGGKYRIVRLIGEGGMGAVFEARHEHLGSHVALKFLLPELAERPGLVGRFLQEARVSAAIRSPHVTQVMDVDQTPDGAPYLVMELLQGESLEQRLARGSPLPVRDALELGVQILAALDAAHAHGVVHRDLKPDNVWLSPSESGPQVKLLDFGIAKLKVSSEFQRINTRPGAMMGTPAYMAPEQAISADQVDVRADLYSFGVILYEMLSGARPVDGDDPATILEKLVRGEVHPLASRCPFLPLGLSALVDRLVAPNPDARPATATFVRTELARYIRVTEYGEPRQSAVPPTVPPSNEGTPPFVSASHAVARTRTDAMPRVPDFAVASTAVASSPPPHAPPARRGALGPVLIVLVVAAIAGAGTWAYMNPSIFEDDALPPLPGPAPSAPATVGRIEIELPDNPPTESPAARPAPRPTAQSATQSGSSQHGSSTPTALPLPTFSLPSSLPSTLPGFPFPLPSTLPPFLQQLPGFSAPSSPSTGASAPAPPAATTGAPASTQNAPAPASTPPAPGRSRPPREPRTRR